MDMQEGKELEMEGISQIMNILHFIYFNNF